MGTQARFEGLIRIMDRLRGPDGCPWDHEQTYASLRRFLLEECYEVAEALDRDEPEELCEELGDLLFQIVFLSRISKEQNRFTIDDVIRGISEKMIRRHPHVFGQEQAGDAAEVLRNWEQIKRKEKASSPSKRGRDSVLDGIPAALPSLLRAQQLGERASRVGFDWERVEDVITQVQAELDELRDAVRDDDPQAVAEEIGDTLFSLVMAARKVGVDSEQALESSNRKFDRRFRWIERELARRGVEPGEAETSEMESLWRRAKSETKRS